MEYVCKKVFVCLKLSEAFWKNLIKTSHLKNAIEIVMGKTASQFFNPAVKMILTQIC